MPTWRPTANTCHSSGARPSKVETSLLWALEPECVDVSRVPPPETPGAHLAMGRNVRLSDRRVGERMVADEVRWLGQKAQELLAAYDREQPQQRLRTYEQVEELWDGVIAPVVKEFASMQDVWGDEQPPPEGSVWRGNWRVPDRV
jgi:hypothetical protein